MIYEFNFFFVIYTNGYDSFCWWFTTYIYVFFHPGNNRERPETKTKKIRPDHCPRIDGPDLRIRTGPLLILFLYYFYISIIYFAFNISIGGRTIGEIGRVSRARGYNYPSGRTRIGVARCTGRPSVADRDQKTQPVPPIFNPRNNINNFSKAIKNNKLFRWLSLAGISAERGTETTRVAAI